MIGALMHAGILENVAAHSLIALRQNLPLRVTLNHPLHDFTSCKRGGILRRRKSCGRKEKYNAS